MRRGNKCVVTYLALNDREGPLRVVERRKRDVLDALGLVLTARGERFHAVAVLLALFLGHRGPARAEFLHVRVGDALAAVLLPMFCS